MSKLNVDRMRRYAHRNRRYVWSREERQELLDHMHATLERWRIEDEEPMGYFPGPRFGFQVDGSFRYFDPLRDGIQVVPPPD